MPEEVFDTVKSEVETNFFMIKNVIVDAYDLTIGAFWLYACLAKFTYRKGYCFPSIKTLASIARSGPKEAGVSEQAIRNWTDELVSKKLISVVEKIGKGKTYTLLNVADLKTPQQRLTPQPRLDDPSTEVEETPQPRLTRIIPREEEKEEYPETPSPSPSPGAASSLPNYRFKDFYSACPEIYKSEKQEKESRAIWHANRYDRETSTAIVQWTSAMTQSSEWTKEGGKYSLAAKTILEKERWKSPLTTSAKYSNQCRNVYDYFLEVTGQPKSTSKLTAERLSMISQRIEEAHQMKADIDPDGERSLMMDAIDAAYSSPYYKKHPEMLTIESVYGSAEKFEKLVKREVPA